MNLVKEDLKYFVGYVLLDEATRTSSGKRQTKPMEGFWLSRHKAPSRNRGKARLRVSDIRERRYVCIDSLHEIGGMSVEEAAATVVMTEPLVSETDQQVQVFRQGYYAFQKVNKDAQLSAARTLWFSKFLDWRGEAMSWDGPTIQFVLEKYGQFHGAASRPRLEVLIKELRSDPVQIARNGLWCEERDFWKTHTSLACPRR